MDRINKFLEKHPVKHKKVLIFQGKRYEITKDDLKKVKTFKSSKCLDSSFKLSRPLDLSYSAKSIKAFPDNKKKDLSLVFQSKFIESIKKGKYNKNTPPKIDKNEIFDIWGQDDLETINAYQQEWVYSIKEQYDKPVEELVFTKEALEKEINTLHSKHFTPREGKTKRLDELVPKLPDIKDLKPYPEFLTKEWNLEGQKTLNGSLLCCYSGNNINVYNIKYDAIVYSFKIEEEIKKAMSNSSGDVIIMTRNQIYKIFENEVAPVVKCTRKIKDIHFDDKYLAILSSNKVFLHDAKSLESIRTIDLKNNHSLSIKIIQDRIILSSPVGLKSLDEEGKDVKTLNYIIDFDFHKNMIYAVNNLKRLFELDDKFLTHKTLVQHEIGLSIKVHKVLNIIAILFRKEIGIYKIHEGNIVPINMIRGDYSSIEWDQEMPWLYSSTYSKTVLFS